MQRQPGTGPRSHLSTAVPDSVAGLGPVHKRYGGLPLKAVLKSEPALAAQRIDRTHLSVDGPRRSDPDAMT